MKLIRSLLISSSDGLLIQDIDNVYREHIGERIPLKMFGFNTIEEFLRASGQFIPTKTAAGIKVTAKMIESSKHVVKLKLNQNVSQSEMKQRKKILNAKSGLAHGPVRNKNPQMSMMSNKPKSTSQKTISSRNHSKQCTAPKWNGLKPRHAINKASQYNGNVSVASEKPATLNVEIPMIMKMPKPSTEKSPTGNLKKPPKIDLHARLALKQSDNSPERAVQLPTSISTPSYTPMTTPTKPRRESIQIPPIIEQVRCVDLRTRLTPKQIEMSQVQNFETDANNQPLVALSHRASFMKKLQDIRKPLELTEKQDKQTKRDQRLVTFKTKLEPMTSESKPKEGRDLHSRLRVKQINPNPSAMQELSQRVIDSRHPQKFNCKFWINYFYS